MTNLDGLSSSFSIGSANGGGNSIGSVGSPINSIDARDVRTWYEAMARAWGQSLDQQAQTITELSAQVTDGQDQPSTMIQLTAESLRMQFLSNNASTSTNSVGQALEALARKQ